MRVGIQVDLFEVAVTKARERLFVGARPRGRGAEQLDDRGALGAAKARVAPADHVGRDPACRFAGPASAIRLHWPVTKSRTSTASPTAKMSGSLVRICSSTRIPPSSPISIQAIRASVVSGHTPSARITRSARYRSPDWVDTVSVSFSDRSNPATPSPSATLTPWRARNSLMTCPYSGSSGPRT
jgi:hypothetical protein